MNILEQRINLIGYVLTKLRTLKNVVGQISKKSHFRRPYEKENGKRFQTLSKSARLHHYYIYWSMWKKLSSETALLVICKILGLLINTLTAVGKYSRLNCDKLKQPIQMKLYKKQKQFSQFFFAFYIKFWTFFKKRWPW